MINRFLIFLRDKKWLLTLFIIILAIGMREYLIFRQIDSNLLQTFEYAHFKESYSGLNANLKLLEYTVNNQKWDSDINLQKKSKFYFTQTSFFTSGMASQLRNFDGNFFDLGESKQIINDILGIESILKIIIYKNTPQKYEIQKNLKLLTQSLNRLNLEIKNSDIRFKKEVERESLSRLLLTLFLTFSTLILFILVFSITNREKNQILKQVQKSIQKFSAGEAVSVINIKNSSQEAQILILLQESLRNFQKVLINIILGFIDQDFDKIEAEFPFDKKGYIGEKIVQLKKTFENSWKENKMKDNRSSELLKYRGELSKIERLMRENSNNSKLYMIVLKEIIHFLNLNQGGFFVRQNKEEELNLLASYAYNSERFLERTIAFKEGLVGACAYEQNLIILDEIPQTYLEITSGLGEREPSNLILLPIVFEKETLAVIELASFKPLEKDNIAFLKDFSASVALFLNSILNAQIDSIRLLDFSESDFVNSINKSFLEILNKDSLQLIKKRLSVAIFGDSLELLNFTRSFQEIIPFKLSTFDTNLAQIIRIDEKEIDLFGEEKNIEKNIIINFDIQESKTFFIHKIFFHQDKINFILFVF